MLHDFLTKHREAIIARCGDVVGLQTTHGVPLFLDQLIETLRLEMSSNPEIGASATKHGKELSQAGFTVSEVVHDYGNVCQSVTRLAVELETPITTSEFCTLNRCLDDAIADAVTEYGQQRQRIADDDGTQRLNERLGVFAHDLRNQLTKALLAFEVLKTGRVGVDGSTAAMLGRSLIGLRDLIDRSLTDVRVTAGILHQERVVLAELVDEVEVCAAMEASARGIRLSVEAVEPSLLVDADRQTLLSVLTNLLSNAFKFSKHDGCVSLKVRTTSDRISIDVADECGGLPPGKAEELFRPFEQRNGDRSGVGLGLAISRRGAEANGGKLDVRDLPGVGCVFTLELPRCNAEMVNHSATG